MNDSPKALMRNSYLINWMNLFIGREFNDNFNEIFSDLEKGKVNENSEKYKELLNKAKYGFPITYVDNKSIPTLCIYGGQDEYVGIAQYAKLKESFKKYNNNNITLIYYKYGHHNYNEPDCEDKRNADNKHFQELLNYCKK